MSDERYSATSITAALRGIVIDRTSVSQLRKAAAVLQGICNVLERKEISHDDPKAIPLVWMGDVQPLCVYGARYVRRTTGWVPYFDSETGSESVDETAASRPSHWAQYLRVKALQLLSRIFLTFPKEFLMRWKMVMEFPTFVLDDQKSPMVPLLLGICRSDPSSKVRSAAVCAVCALVSSPHLRTFPVPLEDLAPPGLAPKTHKFNTMTGTIALYIRLAHIVFASMLRADSGVALHGMAEFASNVPYHHLRAGILSSACQALEPLFQRMRVAATEDTQCATSQAVIHFLLAIFAREKTMPELITVGTRLFELLHGVELQKLPFVIDLLVCLARIAQGYPESVDPTAAKLTLACRAALSHGAWNDWGERIMAALEKCPHVPALACAKKRDVRALHKLLELGPRDPNALVALSEIAKDDPHGSRSWCRDAMAWLPTTYFEGKQGIVCRALGYFAALEALPVARNALHILADTKPTMATWKTQWNAYAAMGHLITNPHLTVDECDICMPALTEGMLSENDKIRAIATRSCVKVVLKRVYLRAVYN
eukprot:GEMP01027071.1.p1 GENE.GEMP01027071.1~~GEMP01027071.1.p1  ORF type:complete len:542 (+),score=97.83 GEMP01027071.1:84-1709(+)